MANWWCARRVGCALIAVGVALCGAAALIQFPVVRAVAVEATVLSNQGTAACSRNGSDLTVSFRWQRRVVTEHDELESCNRSYRSGEHLGIYAASNDPSDTGNTAQSILGPPGVGFNDLGPNGGTGILEGFGLWFFAAGIVTLVIDWRRRRRGKAARSRHQPDAAAHSANMPPS
jgi:hypothetical protein